MNNICAIFDDVSISQSSFGFIQSFNRLSSSKNSVYCFYNNISAPPTQALFSMLNIYYINCLTSGHAIATNLNTAKTLLNVNTAVKKYLYLWDLEWLRSPLNFLDVVSILTNPQIEIITRSNSHAILVENYTNQKVRHILEDWNPEKLLEIING